MFELFIIDMSEIVRVQHLRLTGAHATRPLPARARLRLGVPTVNA